MYKLAACSIRLQGRKLSFLICFHGVMLSFSHWVISNSLWPHELQDARFLFPSLSPWVCSNSCPLSQWFHPTISSSVTTFSSCLQSFPASGSFPESWLFASGGQHSGASASASVLWMNFQGWFYLGNLLVWSPFCPRNSQESSPAPQFKSITSLWSNSHIHTWLLEKP